MRKIIPLFISYIDELFPEIPMPLFEEAIDCCEIPEFVNMPERKYFSKTIECFDAFLWFSPKQFLYYLPELIKSSLKDLEKFEYIVDTLFDDHDTYGADPFKLSEKWSLLSEEQLLSIQIWLCILRANSQHSEFHKIISKAIEDIELRRMLCDSQA